MASRSDNIHAGRNRIAYITLKAKASFYKHFSFVGGVCKYVNYSKSGNIDITCGGFCYVAGSPRVYRGSPDREGAHPAPHEQACSTPIVPLPIVMAGYGCVVSHPGASSVDCRHCESVCHCDCAVHENGSSRHHGNVVGCLYLRVSRCFAREPVAG
ncbi:hypothetical protein JYU34_018610 [Plutella xylostella]|uniref:Uncharacterized protein n=1 Tax=Plutella xylostella TaxID=51655 RepID=A0ABQ7PZE3_PLUXY|nr:hypothetical protein JYU34_018610 [Plutella xylostella]